MKKVMVFTVSLCLFLMVIASYACADVDYSSKIRQVYNTCLNDKNNGNSYNGWCGRYVLHQLEVNGINYVGSGTFNGNEIYYDMVDGATTSSGYIQKKFSGNNALYDIVNQYGSLVENIVVSFTYQYGYSNSNPGAGHTNFIYAIADGMVWFSESYTGVLGNEGSPICISLADYMRRYNSSYGNIIGAVYYMPGYTSIRKVDEYYLCKGVTLDPSTQEGHYGFTLEPLFGKVCVDGYHIPYDESEGNSISPEMIPVQATIHVAEVVKNKNGVQWYRADQISYYMAKNGDGDVKFYVEPVNLFIKPDDVAYQYKGASVTPGIYKVVEPNQTQWGRAPFDANHNGTAIMNGEEVIVACAVENKYGNIWYRLDSLSSEKWVYSGHLQFVRTNVTVDFSVNNATPEYGLPKTQGYGIPTGNLPKGQSYELRGVVTASENIQSITGTIYDLDTGAVVSGIGTNPITIYPNSTSVDIFTSQVNYSLKFNSMNDGAYRYELVVTTVSGLTKTVADSTFTIGSGILPDIPSPTPLPDVLITSVALNQKSTSLQVGKTITLNAVISPGNATNKSLQWKSSNTAVATVDSSGNVKAVGLGNATISATSTDGTGIADTCHITVSPQLSSPDMVLPSGLKRIEEEAFAGLGFKEMYIRLPEGLEQIGSRAFADYSKKLTIYIPASVTSIHDRAFENTNVLILCNNGSQAQQFAVRKGYSYYVLDALSDWVLASNVPQNAVIVNSKTQYSYRDRGSASYSAWGDWSAWSETRQEITDSNLKQEEAKTQCRWWAAKCLNCGQHNPYHAQNCKNCGTYLDSNKADIVWISVFQYTDDTSGTSTILGRSGGRYFDGAPYWNTNQTCTAYHYRTRTLQYAWGAWSAWTDTAVTATETRQVQTRTMVQYRIN